MKGVSSDCGDLTFLKGERERKGIQGGSLGLQQVPRKFHWNYPPNSPTGVVLHFAGMGLPLHSCHV